MANTKISALTSATTVAGTEVLPIVQSSATVKVAISDLNPGLSTILATKGGTGQTTYAVGDLLYASATTTLSRLADVATGNALISGGVTTAPSWGKIGLTTHVSGALPTANGGTNLTSFTANGIVYASSASVLATSSAFTFNGSTTVNLTSSTSASVINIINSTSTFEIQQNGSDTYLSNYNASGSQIFRTNGVERIRIDASGNALVTNVAGLGYGTGSGGTVTQATSKSTGVTLNKPTGQITMNNASLLTNTIVQFQFNNSLLTTTDVLQITQQSGNGGSGNYNVWVYGQNSGSAFIAVKNISAFTLSDALVLNFAIIKGATA